MRPDPAAAAVLDVVRAAQRASAAEHERCTVLVDQQVRARPAQAERRDRDLALDARPHRFSRTRRIGEDRADLKVVELGRVGAALDRWIEPALDGGFGRNHRALITGREDLGGNRSGEQRGQPARMEHGQSGGQ